MIGTKEIDGIRAFGGNPKAAISIPATAGNIF